MEEVKLIVEVPDWVKKIMDETKKRTGVPIKVQVFKALVKFYTPYMQYIKKGSYKEIEDEFYRMG